MNLAAKIGQQIEWKVCHLQRDGGRQAKRKQVELVLGLMTTVAQLREQTAKFDQPVWNVARWLQFAKRSATFFDLLRAQMLRAFDQSGKLDIWIDCNQRSAVIGCGLRGKVIRHSDTKNTHFRLQLRRQTCGLVVWRRSLTIVVAWIYIYTKTYRNINT